MATTADNSTGFRFNEWGWSAATMDGVTATLTIPTPGVYTVTVWAREDGVRVDRLLLTTDTAYLPSGSGPAESPRTGGGQALLLPAPDSQVTTALTANPEYARQVARAQRLALVWANILANPGGLAMAPLALIAPFAANPRRKRKSEWSAALSLAVVLFGVSLALLNGGMMMGGMPGGVAEVYAAPEMAISNSTIDYSYDPLYRLTNASYDSGGSFGYSYDAAGNRLESQIDGTPVMSYSYDVANRLVQTNDLVASILAHYSYDDNGNLLADGEYSYSYDSANRLVGVDDGISTMQYEYNGDGVRIAQIVDGLRTDYVQDIATSLPQVLTARQGGTVNQYLQGLGLIGEAQGGVTPGWQYHLPDALGTVRQLVDEQGAVSLSRTYDPFGGLLNAEGTASSAYGFAGEEQDEKTGQLYLRARTYSPGTGRFLQQDSVLGQTNQPRTLHRYTYAFNNPVNYTDPSGHMPGNSQPPQPIQNNNGGDSLPDFKGGSPNFFPSPDRSVNQVSWQQISDQAARFASEGFRAAQCGFAIAMSLLPGLQRIGDGFARISNQIQQRANQLVGQLEEVLGPRWGIAIGAAIIASSIVITGGAAIVPILVGATIGAGISYGFQVWQNRQGGMAWQEALTSVDVNQILRGAFQGAVSGAVAGAIAPALSGGPLIKTLATGGAELISGRLEQIAVNLASGHNGFENVWNPSWLEIALDVLPGVGATAFKPALRGASFHAIVEGLEDAAQIKYAPALESGLTRKMQRDLVGSLDEGGVIAVRSRPYRAAGLESKYPPKGPDITPDMVVRKYKNGVRELVDGRKVLSDLDVAGYTVNGQRISNKVFLDTFAKRFKQKYGYNIITHGPLVEGLDDIGVIRNLGYKRIQQLFNEDVFVFDKTGFVEKLSYIGYERKYIGKRIELYGFRGTGSTAEEFIETEPLIYAGHVGISLDNGKTIYGFTPSTQNLSNSQVINILKQHESFPGQVLDDTALFHRAQELAEQGYRTQVYVQSILLPHEEFNRIYRQILEDIDRSPLPNKPYAFPGPEDCFNCATYPSSLGVPIPEPSGNLRLYMEELKRVGIPWRK